MTRNSKGVALTHGYKAIDLDGVLLLDKPAGPSSNAILQHVKKLFNARKAGHAGTLDPLATGLLPLCFGEATKFGMHLLNADKSYEASIRLGVITSTGDAEGTVVETRPVTGIEDEKVLAVLKSYRGRILQTPPMFSALKVNGQPLYRIAREGRSIERLARPVDIHELRLRSFHANADSLDVTVTCSKGTYIRTLAEDIGRDLGCGGHLISLRRIAVGPIGLADAVSLPVLEDASVVGRMSHMKSPEILLGGLPRLKLTELDAKRFLSGGTIKVSASNQYSEDELLAVDLIGNGFLGVGQVLEGILHPKRLFSHGFLASRGIRLGD